MLITAVITTILVIGIKESAKFNNIMVVIKLLVVLFVIGVGVFYIDTANWVPFAPFGYTGISFFGETIMGQTDAGGKPLGMLSASAIIFFAYIGFDSVSTHAEEAKNPKRDVPVAIVASLLICTFLYIAVAAVLTGMIPYKDIKINAPVSDAFAQKGIWWAEFVIAFGALTGITSVLLVTMLSQPRVLLAMARDGLLPDSFFGAIHEKYRTPYKSTILTGCFVALLSGFLPLRILSELVSIGTLMAFVIVCVAVLIMRQTNPEAERPFRAPLYPFVPLAGIGICGLLMFSLPSENWLRLIVWLGLGFMIYFVYGRHHSHMAKENDGTRIPE
jgi:APA family basic amino acid/polyamine antiporter